VARGIFTTWVNSDYVCHYVRMATASVAFAYTPISLKEEELRSCTINLDDDDFGV